MSDAQALILVAWLVVGLAFIGLGVLVRRALGLELTGGAEGWLGSFWLGFSGAIALLQLWQLAWPVDDRALAGFLVLGGAGLVLEGKRLSLALLRGFRRGWPALLALALAAWWISNHALGGPRNGDSGLYHVPMVCWFDQHRLVPGLVNLDFAFGYSQSYFLYAALLDKGPFLHGAHHLANSLLLLALLARVLWGALALARPGAGGLEAQDLYYALWLPVALHLTLDINLTSPAPDFAVFVLGVVLAGELVGLVARSRSGSASAEPLALALLACAATTLKLTVAADAAATLGVGIAWWLRRARPTARRARRPAMVIAAVLLLVLVPWMARAVILSGYPLYPAHFAPFPVDWRAPTARFMSIWPRSAVQDATHRTWLAMFARSWGWNQVGVVLPLALAGNAALLVLPLRHLGSLARPPLPRTSGVILLPTALALIFWFVSSPMARFAGAAFWVLAALMVLLALEGQMHRWRLARVVLLGVLLATAAGMLARSRHLLRHLSDFEPMAAPIVRPVTLPSRLKIWYAERYQQCWDAPLPCTPWINPALRLRRPGDLESGFTVEPPARSASGGGANPAVSSSPAR